MVWVVGRPGGAQTPAEPEILKSTTPPVKPTDCRDFGGGGGLGIGALYALKPIHTTYFTLPLPLSLSLPLPLGFTLLFVQFIQAKLTLHFPLLTIHFSRFLCQAFSELSD